MADENREQMLFDLRNVVRQLGLEVDTADVIADGVHMVVHLRPADVVARVATLYPQDTPSQRRHTLAIQAFREAFDDPRGATQPHAGDTELVFLRETSGRRSTVSSSSHRVTRHCPR